jgi:outer membrane protein
MKIRLLLLFLLLPVIMFAENYSLDQLIDYALENNTALKQSQLRLNRSRTALSSARVNYLPEVSAEIGRRENFATSPPETNQTTNFMGFSVQKSIALNNTEYFSNKNARHDFTIEQIRFEMDMQQTIFNLIENYIRVLENQMRLRLLDENIIIQESIVSESQLLLRQNRITPFDVQQSEINLLNARIENLNARNNLNISRKRLFDIINITDEGLELAEINLYGDEMDNFIREIDFDNILEIRQQNEAVNRHRTAICRTRLDFFPSINLRYNYGRTLSSSDFAYDNRRTDHTLSLNLSYSLNNLLKNRFSWQQVQSLAEHNELDTAQLQRNISLRYGQFIEELNYLQQLQILNESKLSQTTINLETAQQRYRLGRLTQLDLDKAIYENHSARINMENSKYQIMLKKLQIDYLLSNVLF